MRTGKNPKPTTTRVGALVAVIGIVAATGVAGCGTQAPRKPAAAATGSAQGGIKGLRDFRKSDAASLKGSHKPGKLTYKQSPPVGGDHNGVWQNCSGDVYSAPIANENAVHSLEHGAVWITYRKGLAADQVAALAAKVKGKDYLMMSPVETLESPISLQAWGYQLVVPSADDARIDEFVARYSRRASLEPGAPCSNGTLRTGTDPKDAP